MEPAMRIAILSDIHANLPALDAVMRHAQRCGVDELWSLGDAIGYGPHPVECIQRLQSSFSTWIIGNHEQILSNLLDMQKHEKISLERLKLHEETEFVSHAWKDYNSISPRAIQAMILNYLALRDTPELEWYRGVIHSAEHQPPLNPKVDSDFSCILVHGSLYDPLGGSIYPWDETAWYLPNAIFEPLAKQPGAPLVAFYGHSHVPAIIRRPADQIQVEDFNYGTPTPLGGCPTAISPGSTGRPSDLDPRASYAILDTSDQSVTHYRVAYDCGKTTDAMLDYPGSLIEDLHLGSVRFGDKNTQTYPLEVQRYLPVLERRKNLPGGGCS
jgi:hypothetical protein